MDDKQNKGNAELTVSSWRQPEERLPYRAGLLQEVGHSG
jgi:hypothetical protein